jgi:hypothetical protein
MPPRGQRFAAALWLASAVTATTVVLGTTLLLALDGRLPDRIVVRWDQFEPAQTLALPQVVWLAAILAVSGFVATILVGLAVHRSLRNLFAGYAAGVSVGLAVGLYANTLEQVGPNADTSPLGLVVGPFAGLAVGWLIAGWVRQPPVEPAPTSTTPLVTLDLSPEARLAWAGWTRRTWVNRASLAIPVAVPTIVVLWWLGAPFGFAYLPIAGALTGRLLATRPREVAIDYSGVGLRSGPSVGPAVPISEIRSAESTIISVPRDFGGWGRVVAPDGRLGWITRSGEALVVHRVGKSDVVYTVDGADEAAAVLNTHVARYRAWLVASRASVDLPHPYGDGA